MFRKIFLAYFVSSLLGLAVCFYATTTILHDQAVKEWTAVARAALDVCRASLKSDIDRPEKTLHERTALYGKIISGTLTVVENDGTVAADSASDPSTLGNLNKLDEVRAAREIGEGMAIRFSRPLQAQVLYLAAPLNDKGMILRIALPLNQAPDAAEKTLPWLVGFFLIVVIAGGVAGHHWFAKELAPLEDIRQALAAIGRGDRIAKLPSVFPGRIGDLAKTANTMEISVTGRMERLLTEKEKLETVITSMEEGLVSLDADGRVEHCSAAAQRLLRVDGDVKGSPFLDWVRNDVLMENIKLVRKTRESSQARLELAGKNLEFGVYYIHSEDGILLVIRDVTQVVKYETLRKEFVGNVSHELRTPLTIIKGYVETLSSGAMDDRESAKKFMETIEKNVHQLDNLVNDLLELSRLESQADVARLAPVDVKKLVNQILSDLDSILRQKEHGIVVELPDSLPLLHADPGLLERALKNLIENAAKYTPPGGQITVRVKASGRNCELEVEDTGIGIPEEHILRIFERFYRVDKSRSREMGGTGLGLAIVKHIAQIHQGSVAVRSLPGKGSVFTIRIPWGMEAPGKA